MDKFNIWNMLPRRKQNRDIIDGRFETINISDLGRELLGEVLSMVYDELWMRWEIIIKFI